MASISLNNLSAQEPVDALHVHLMEVLYGLSALIYVFFSGYMKLLFL